MGKADAMAVRDRKPKADIRKVRRFAKNKWPAKKTIEKKKKSDKLKKKKKKEKGK